MKTESKIIIMSIIAAFTFWVLDTILDHFIFYKGATSFIGMLVSQIPAPEVFSRLLILASFVAFGFIMSSYITQRKVVEQKILQSEEQKCLVLENMIAAYALHEMLYDADGNPCDYRFIAINESFIKLVGIPDPTGKTVREAIPDVEQKWIDIYGEVVKTGQHKEFEEFSPSANIWWQVIAYKVKDNQFVTIFMDITERKLRTEKLRKSKIFTDRLIETANVMIVGLDNKANVTIFNSTAEKITGYSKPEILNKNWFETIVPHEKYPKVRNEFKRILKSNKEAPKIFENPILTKFGEERIISWRNSRVEDSEGNISIISFGLDITETIRLQEFAARAQRLEIAGRIAGQVAHDFNNLLGPMTAYPGLIKEELDEAHPAHELLDQMQNSALQIAEINQQLLTLGRRGHYNLEPVNLNEIIHQVLLQYSPFAQTTVIEKNLSPDLFYLRGGKAQIFRVISNLFSNALDAISEVGKLVISTENYYVDSIEEKYGRVPQGEYIKFTISDNGCGIEPESLSKIFDPFFSTKNAEGRRGSGLGLSIVHAVVEDHNGYLDFTTQKGKGTSFYLYFPIIRDSIRNNDFKDTLIGGNEKILIVDDDLTQRQVTSILLEKLGYSVSTCASGEKAIAELEREKFDLLLLDMIMPGGIDGSETYARALKINPEQKALIISGFAENKRVQKALKMGVGGFLRKPLTIKTIALAARQELDRKIEKLSET